MDTDGSDRELTDTLAPGSGLATAAESSDLENMQPQEDLRATSLRKGDARSVLPLSMQMMKPFCFVCCRECDVEGMRRDGLNNSAVDGFTPNERDKMSDNGSETPTADPKYSQKTHGNSAFLSPNPNTRNLSFVEAETVENSMIREYTNFCGLYGCSDRVNAGVLTTLRFSLPSLRVSGSFHDADMLALCEVLLRHCNGALKYIQRLDFSIASKEGKLHGKKGFRSHGAFTLSKLLQQSEHIEEVYIQHNRVGPYGSSALFLAASTNPVLRTLMMRRCRIGERGAMAFADHVCKSQVCGLKEVDLSINQIGFKGSIAIEKALLEQKEDRHIEVDLEGNLVFQEVMNCVTHGMGIVLCIVGCFFLSNRVKHKSTLHVVSCAVYSMSLLVLYTSSTLYHSFFALQRTKYIFEVFDKCAIYILIAGSYTPFLRIALAHNHLWSVYLLAFIWTCCFGGIFVEAFCPTWRHKPKFSLTMYLGMGWSCLVCLTDLLAVLPQEGVNLIILGGVGYTSGVPFFVRNNNLDHSIWHCFVLAGSLFHWLAVYCHVAVFP